jgi:hypothetical protein
VSDRVFGFVINVNAYGATVRLEGGELASAPAGDVEAHRAEYERSIATQQAVAFILHPGSRRPMVTIVPRIDEPELDEKIAHYLESTQEWENDADGVPAHERHFLRKKKRAAAFESKQPDAP